MDAAATVHPTDQTLEAHGLGQLDDNVAGAVGRHLDCCDQCQSRFADPSARDGSCPPSPAPWRSRQSCWLLSSCSSPSPRP
jgi:anti-sigma factor ChrR (cupin superfamily)